MEWTRLQLLHTTTATTTTIAIATWIGAIARYCKNAYIGGTRICHFGIAKTELTLAPTRMPCNGVDARLNGKMLSWNMHSSDPGVVYMRMCPVVALLLCGVCGLCC
jgi:hypothetical protein